VGIRRIMQANTSTLFSYAFRIFFLLMGVFAIYVTTVWIMTLHGKGFAGLTPLWHGHEMLMGFALAAVAGFSLTAVANWTGRPALKGTPLVLLALSWLAGRLAMTGSAMLPGSLPNTLVLVLDMLFPVLLLILLGREIIAGNSRRNYPLIFIIAIVALLNGLYHLGTGGWVTAGDRLAIFLLIHTIILLVTIIAGRIVPAFTTNWLRSQGQDKLPVNSDWINRLALSLTILTGLAAGFLPQAAVTGILAFAAAGVHGFRLSRWRGFATLSNPLLFVLHGAYAWLPIGYALLGCAVFGWLFPATVALHALTMGAIGSIVLAVTTRVALGHTGRPLQAARATVLAYWIFMLAVVVRVMGPLAGSAYLPMIDLSAAGWLLTFLIFTWVYWPILTRPATSAS
jgi:uncharacterized protein involved in response to NO